MTDIKFKCPHCQQSLEAPPDMSGEMIECPTCEKTITIPQSLANKPKLALRQPSAPPRPNPPPAASLACKYCGAQHGPDAVFCVGCGRNLKTGKPLQPRTERPQKPIRAQSGISGGTLLLLIVLGVGGYFGWQHISKSSSTAPSAGNPHSQPSANTSQSSAVAPEPAQPQPFRVNVKVAAFTLKGTQFPNHSITYELYVNGEKVRSMDGTSISMTFPSVSVQAGDVLSGRALWRNGYGAIGQVNASYQDTKTVTESDRGKDFFLKTYDGEYLSTPENRHEWY
jgi:DNA-directed RNA polymerase subunit RPC12/RpoP